MHYSENQSWIIEFGDDVIEKKADGTPLSDLERLVHCLWVADYGIRNAGDLDAAFNLDSEFLADGLAISRQLGLAECKGLFSLDARDFQLEYKDRFEKVCDELKSHL